VAATARFSAANSAAKLAADEFRGSRRPDQGVGVRGGQGSRSCSLR
jgi:hypothetical protein